MPDYPKAPPHPRRAMMRPISSLPALERVLNTMDQRFPADMMDTEVTPRAFDHPLAKTNIVGSTSPMAALKQHIEMDPVEAMAFPPAVAERTLAHELQHARDFREMPQADIDREMEMPYSERPHEKRAYAAQKDYQDKYHPEFHGARIDPVINAAFPDSPYVDPPVTPAMRSLRELIAQSNGRIRIE